MAQVTQATVKGCSDRDRAHIKDQLSHVLVCIILALK